VRSLWNFVLYRKFRLRIIADIRYVTGRLPIRFPYSRVEYFQLRQLNYNILNEVGWVAQSVYRLATGWTVRGSNHGGGEIFRTCPDRPWGTPSLLCNGYQVFPGGRKRPGRDADPSPPSSAEV
jgi:hypothetical protein